MYFNNNPFWQRNILNAAQSKSWSIPFPCQSDKDADESWLQTKYKERKYQEWFRFLALKINFSQ